MVDFAIDLSESLLSPVEHVVIFESSGSEQTSEETAEICVVRLVTETQGPGVIDIRGEFVREDALAELFSRELHFLLLDQLPFLLFSGGLETLPWQATSKIYQDIS